MPAKRVLVTGSSRGIGRVAALRLAESGWSVVVHGSSDSSALTSIVEELGENCGGKVFEDLALEGAADRLFAGVLESGPIDAIVNCAGIYTQTSFTDSSDADWSSAFDDIFQVNWHAPLRLTRLACQHFNIRGGGRVVQVCSRVAHKGEAMAASYAASKAALLNLTRSLAVEHAQTGIQHFAVAPGWVDTAMARESVQVKIDEILEGIPAGRMAAPEDCANAINWLLSGEADYMSGLVIDINGASYLR